MSKLLRYKVPVSLVMSSCVLLGAALFAIDRAQAQETTPSARPRPTTPLNRRLTEAELREIPPEDIKARVLELIAARRAAASGVRGASGSVTATARCDEGYVARHRSQPSASDIVIVAEELRDCDPRGCRAVQVTARRDNPAPFDLDLSVSCSG